MRKIYLSLFACLFALQAYADDRSVVAAEYWMDSQQDNRTTVSIEGESAQFEVDASGLAEGLHTLHYRVRDDAGNYSPALAWLFFRYVSPTSGTYLLEYWIDEGTHQTTTVNGADAALIVDAATVAEGLHTLHYRLNTTSGQTGSEQAWQFYRIPSKPAGSRIAWYRIWWNDHPDRAVTVQIQDGGGEYLYEEVVAVPEYARNDGYTRNYTARFHIVFGDDQGNISPMQTAVVGYPDVYPPVTTLTASATSTSVKLEWSADMDDVRDYNVYYSENDEPYVLWLSHITQTSATFRAQPNTSYRFMVTGRDQKNNYEAMDEARAVKVTIK